MKKIIEHTLKWDELSDGFGLPIDKVKEMLDDGRILGRIGEYIDAEKDGGIRVNENSKFDVLKSNNTKREIRSAKNKVSFASSKEVGYGRTVTEEGFKEKLDSVDDFGIVDSREFTSDGKLSIYLLTKDDVLNLGLGKNKSMSADKFWKKIEEWN
jgi:hypothetical protein